MRRIGEGVLLTAIVIFGAFLRFGGLAIPSLWLDEILDYDVATKLTHEPFWRWLTGFASEHGPLFFATVLTSRTCHSACKRPSCGTSWVCSSVFFWRIRHD